MDSPATADISNGVEQPDVGRLRASAGCGSNLEEMKPPTAGAELTLEALALLENAHSSPLLNSPPPKFLTADEKELKVAPGCADEGIPPLHAATTRETNTCPPVSMGVDGASRPSGYDSPNLIARLGAHQPDPALWAQEFVHLATTVHRSLSSFCPREQLQRQRLKELRH